MEIQRAMLCVKCLENLSASGNIQLQRKMRLHEWSVEVCTITLTTAGMYSRILRENYWLGAIHDHSCVLVNSNNVDQICGFFRSISELDNLFLEEFPEKILYG